MLVFQSYQTIDSISVRRLSLGYEVAVRLHNKQNKARQYAAHALQRNGFQLLE